MTAPVSTLEAIYRALAGCERCESTAHHLYGIPPPKAFRSGPAHPVYGTSYLHCTSCHLDFPIDMRYTMHPCCRTSPVEAP